MNKMRSWSQLFRKPKSADLENELRFHLEELVRENISKGLSPDQARRKAGLEFGGPETIKEEIRDVHRIPIFDSLFTRVRYALRTLRARPSFSLTVIITLTLGIGANTAVFSAVDAVLPRALPYPNANRLVIINELNLKQKSPESPVAPTRLEDWNRLNGTFEAISGYYTEDTTTTSSGFYTEDTKDAAQTVQVRIKRAFVAPHFLQAVGVSPALGHDFTNEDEHSHGYAPPSVLISDRFWREHFHSDRSALGRPLIAGKSSERVIGIMPPGSRFLLKMLICGTSYRPMRHMQPVDKIPGTRPLDA